MVDLLVVFSLVFDIVGDDLFVGVLAYGIDIVPLCPEFPSPQLSLYFGMLFEDLSRRDAFGDLDDPLWEHGWDGLYEKVHMIFVSTDFEVVEFIPE